MVPVDGRHGGGALLMAAAVHREADLFLLRESDVQAELNVSVATLRRWRKSGKGPAFLKLEGGAIRYEREALAEWLRAQRGDMSNAE